MLNASAFFVSLKHRDRVAFRPSIESTLVAPEWKILGRLSGFKESYARVMKKILFRAVVIFVSMVPFPLLADAMAPVVTNKWLAEHLGEKGLSVIEMSNEASFEFDGHIPGAVFTEKSFWRREDTDGALVRLPDRVLERRIRELGVNESDRVVIYYKGDNLNEVLGAYYLYWLFHYLGHTNVAMLERGWPGWLAAGAPIETNSVNAKPGNFVARPLPSLAITTDELYAIHGNYTVIDGRPAANFAGRAKFPSNTRYGRIPGSTSQPWADYLGKDKDGRIFIDAAMTPPLLKNGMISKKEPLLLTCFGGTGAAITYTLFYNQGYRNMRLNDAGLRRWNARFLPLKRDPGPPPGKPAADGKRVDY